MSEKVTALKNAVKEAAFESGLNWTAAQREEVEPFVITALQTDHIDHLVDLLRNTDAISVLYDLLVAERDPDDID